MNKKLNFLQKKNDKEFDSNHTLEAVARDLSSECVTDKRYVCVKYVHLVFFILFSALQCLVCVLVVKWKNTYIDK